MVAYFGFPALFLAMCVTDTAAFFVAYSAHRA